MKFVYKYRTHDNKPREGVINAPTRDSVFILLKAKGIRPSHVAEAPGFFNKLFGKGKRWIAIAVLAIIAIVSTGLVIVGLDTENAPTVEMRSQVYGDPELLQECMALDWANVFENQADRFLALYAQPGLETRELDEEAACQAAEALAADACRMIQIGSDDKPEIKKIKRIINGMKIELGRYISDGGNYLGYVERLGERQKVEISISKAVRQEFQVLERKGERAQGDELIRLKQSWREKNQLLRELGMLSVPMPEEWANEDLVERK